MIDDSTYLYIEIELPIFDENITGIGTQGIEQS